MKYSLLYKHARSHTHILCSLTYTKLSGFSFNLLHESEQTGDKGEADELPNVNSG